VARSRDGTVKIAFRLEDGAAIESVLIPAAGRTTLCVSTQAGCAMGCRFCRTGAAGFRRDLTAAEIVNQVAAARELLLAEGSGGPPRRHPIDNLVFMGMGEPLANYRNLLAALAVLGDERGPAFSERRLTVSTCGLAARIRDLGRDARVNLAVSLHTVDDAVRSDLMPVNRSCGVDELLAACREYAGEGRRVVFFECVLLAGVNDTDADARRLAERLRGIPCRINLLEYNEAPSLPFRRSPAGRVTAFKDILHAAGHRTMLRHSRGADIAAACGQLAAGAPP
jgi:23S rRNA (adenine2503-C2)-methyltransferase